MRTRAQYKLTVRRDERGFTLIEIIVGLAISTLILGAAASVFVTTLQSWQRGSQTHKILQIAQTTSDLIERHLRCAVSPSTGNNVSFTGLDLSDGERHGHQLIFMSAAPGRFPRRSALTDMSEIEFTLDPLDGQGMTMRIDSTPGSISETGEDTGYRASLSPMVSSFQVTYFDGTDWLEEWIGTDLPQAVEFSITISDPEEISPVTGQPRTYDVSRLVSMPTVKPAETPDASSGLATPTPAPTGQSR